MVGTVCHGIVAGGEFILLIFFKVQAQRKRRRKKNHIQIDGKVIPKHDNIKEI